MHRLNDNGNRHWKWSVECGERERNNRQYDRSGERGKHRVCNDHLYIAYGMRYYYDSKCKRRADRHQRGSYGMRGCD